MSFLRIITFLTLAGALSSCTTTARDPQSVKTPPSSAEAKSTDIFGLSLRYDLSVTGSEFTAESPEAVKASPRTRTFYAGARQVHRTPHCRLFTYELAPQTALRTTTMFFPVGHRLRGEESINLPDGSKIDWRFISLSLANHDGQKVRFFCEFLGNPGENLPDIFSMIRKEAGRTFNFYNSEQIRPFMEVSPLINLGVQTIKTNAP